MPNDFNELEFSFIPITSCNVSYGVPVIDNNMSFGLNNAKNAVDKACDPDIN